MESILDIIFSKYEVLLLVILRVSGIFIFSPFFSGQNIPNISKIGLTFSISLLISLVLPPVNIGHSLLIGVMFKEVLVGTIIGFIAYIFFTTFYVMGQIIDMKIGFGMVNVVDPQSKIQVPITGNFYYILAFLLLMGINGHHKIIISILDSYSYIPIGSFKMTNGSMNLLIDGLSKAFELGFKLSTPIVATIFATDIILGIMAKTIPQMNVFVVGMPLKLMIGLFVILISMQIFYGGAETIFEIIYMEIYKFIKLKG